MEVRAEISYPTGSADDAFAMAVDKEFRVAVCQATAAVASQTATLKSLSTAIAKTSSAEPVG